MNLQETKLQEMRASFGSTILKEWQNFGETTFEVGVAQLIAILEYAKDPKYAGYEVLMDLTCIDYLEPARKMEIVYWLHNPVTYHRLRVKIPIDRDGAVPSVTKLWPGADWYEREIYDLFGVVFDGHPDLKRILMPDDWVGYPLRKDYALTEEPVEFKFGVEPKVPSQII